MAEDTLPGDAFAAFWDAFNGAYADGTPLTARDGAMRGLEAAAGLIREQQRRQIRQLAVDTNATCEGDGVTYPFADVI